MSTVMDELVKTESLLSLMREETGKDVELSDRLDSLGIDSLEFVSLLQSVEAKFNVVIPEEKYACIDTVRNIRELI